MMSNLSRSRSCPDLLETDPTPHSFLTIRVNDSPVNALLDSGNTYRNLISKDYFINVIGGYDHNIQTLPKQNVQTANSSDLNVLGVPDFPIYISIGTFHHRIRLKPVIVDKLPCSVNLCATFLAQLQLSIDFSKNCATYLGHKLPLLASEHEKIACNQVSGRAYADQTVSLAPNHWRYLPLRVPAIHAGFMPPEDGLLQSFSSFESTTDLHPWKLVALRPSSQGFLVAGIMNTTDREITVPRGTLFGSYRLVTSIHNPKPGFVLAIMPEDKYDESKLPNSPHKSWTAEQKRDYIVNNFDLSSPLLADNDTKTLAVNLLIQYFDVISVNGEFGRTTLIEHEINTGDSAPIRCKQSPIPPTLNEALRKQLSVWTEQGIIRRSKSPYAFKTFGIPKKDDDMRFVIDFRLLNNVTLKDSFPLPNVADTLNRLSNSCIFSTLDMSGAFHCVPIRKQDQHKTAFSTPYGLFEFTHMPFGLCNAPSTFARLITRVLDGIPLDEVLPYLDDTILHSRDLPTHFHILGKTLKAFRQAGLKLKPSKCFLFADNVEFLGHHVSKEGISPTKKYTAILKDWPFPTTKGAVRTFIGKCTYYRRFIKNFSKRVAPLQEAVVMEGPDKTPFPETPARRAAFDDIKQALVSAPILAFPDFKSKSPFLLDTDWSADTNTIGAVLSQVQDGKERVIAYGAKKLPASAKRYAPHKGELCAIIYFIRYWKYFLQHRPFVLRTDHHSLTSLKHMCAPSGQTLRWFDILANYDFEVLHRPGKLHSNADALSRVSHAEQLPEPRCPERVMSTSLLPSNQARRGVAFNQDSDEDLSFVKALVRANRLPSKQDLRDASPNQLFYLKLFPNLIIKDNILRYQLSSGASRICLPQNMIPSALTLAHDHAGHQALEKTLENLRRRLFFPKMQKTVIDYISACIPCQRKNGKPKDQRHTLRSSTGGAPLLKWSIDFVGPLPHSAQGNSYLFTCKDTFSRWIEAIPTPGMTSHDAIAALKTHVFSRFGIPLEIHSDNGPAFVSNSFQSFCKDYDINHTFTPVYNPKSNTVERAHRDLNAMLRAHCLDEPHTWEQHLPNLLFAMRCSKSDSTSLSAYEIVFGQEPSTPLDCMVGDPPTLYDSANMFHLSHKDKLARAFSQARTALKEAVARQERNHYKRLPHSFNVNDLVWHWTDRLPPGACHKVSSHWSGPWTIIRKLNDVTYELQAHSSWCDPTFTTIASIDLIKEYTLRRPNNHLFLAATPSQDNVPPPNLHPGNDLPPVQPVPAEPEPAQPPDSNDDTTDTNDESDHDSFHPEQLDFNDSDSPPHDSETSENHDISNPDAFLDDGYDGVGASLANPAPPEDANNSPDLSFTDNLRDDPSFVPPANLSVPGPSNIQTRARSKSRSSEPEAPPPLPPRFNPESVATPAVPQGFESRPRVPRTPPQGFESRPRVPRT